MITIGFFYHYSEQGRFDLEYYQQVHLPMWMQLHAGIIHSCRTETGVCVFNEGVTKLYEVITYFEYDDIAEFRHHYLQHKHLFWSDLDHFSTTGPVMKVFSEEASEVK